MAQKIEIIIQEIIEKQDLKNSAISAAKDSLLESIKSDEERGLDFLSGWDLKDIIYHFDRYEYHFNDNLDNGNIIVRIGLYINDVEGAWHSSLEPIGHYSLVFDLEGKNIDDFITIDRTKTSKFFIEQYIEKLNSFLPKKYLRRNIIQYEFITYISHAITLFQSADFNESAWQAKRAYEFLQRNDNETKIDSDYLDICKEFLTDLVFYLHKNELLSKEIVEKLIDKNILKRQANNAYSK